MRACVILCTYVFMCNVGAAVCVDVMCVFMCDCMFVFEWSVCADVWHVHVCLNLHQKHTLLAPGGEGILPLCDDSGILEVLSVQFPSPTWKA